MEQQFIADRLVALFDRAVVSLLYEGREAQVERVVDVLIEGEAILTVLIAIGTVVYAVRGIAAAFL